LREIKRYGIIKAQDGRKDQALLENGEKKF
jgi:hypothetical protein